MSLEILVTQLEKSLNSGLYFLALSVSLTLPDIAGAISSKDGRATKERYTKWYEQWVRPKFSANTAKLLAEQGIFNAKTIENPLDGETCYYYRCATLHQARSTHDKSKFSRVMFIEPNTVQAVIHYGILNNALIIDLKSFCHEMTEGFTDWLESAKGTENYEKNIFQTVRRHPNGLKPYVYGAPVIS